MSDQKRSPIKDPTFKHREGETSRSEEVDEIEDATRAKKAKKSETMTASQSERQLGSVT